MKKIRKLVHILRSSEQKDKIKYTAPFKIISDLTPTFKKRGIEGALFVLGVDDYEDKDSFGQALKIVKSYISIMNAKEQYSKLEVESYEDDGISNVFPKLYDYVKRIKPDIILASTPLFAEIFALRELKKRISIPIINYCGSNPIKRKISNDYEVSGFEFLKENKDVFDRHVAISKCTKKYLSELGIEAEVIYAGVNPDQYDRNKNQREQDSKEKKIVMYSGRFHVDKGANLIPNIIEKVLREYSDAQFLIAGYGPMHKKLAQELRNFKGDVFLGTLDSNKLRKAYCKAHTYFQPSKFEAFCISVVEAMAAGNNIIYSGLENIALNEIVGNVGIPIAELNPKLYAEKIVESLENRKVPNKDAIERVKEMFDIQKKANEWIKVLNSL